MLFEKNGTQYLPVASTTKIMTCILALESCSMEESCEVSANAAAAPQVHLGLVSKDRFRLGDLIYAMMLESDNDAAVAVAEHVAGSVKAFADRMNEKARLLGMEHTHFVTPNGLDEGDNGSTAEDMARLCAYAIQNDLFLKIIDTPAWSFSNEKGTRYYSVTNHDGFLNRMEGALGIKTGFTGKAGYCFAGAVYSEGKRLIGVVLATGWPPHKERKWADMEKLIRYGLEEYERKTVLVPEQEEMEVKVAGGKQEMTGVKLEDGYSLLLASEDEVQVRFELPEQLTAPVEANVVVGAAKVLINGRILESFPLYTTESVPAVEYGDCLKELLSVILL